MLRTRSTLLASIVGFSLVGLTSDARAADHLEAPGVFADGRLDINDVYAFQSPANPDNVVLIMTVNPAAGVMSPTTFNPLGVYELNVDNDGDARADITFAVTFGRPLKNGRQSVLVRRNGRLIARGLTGRNVRVRAIGGGTFLADVFDDPFFFDLLGFRDDFTFTGDDFFEGLNVSAFVLEIPRATLGNDRVGVWGRTLVDGVQFDRMGRPAINTVLIATGFKDSFNDGDPVDDLADFGEMVSERITMLSGNATLADMLTMVLLPDILTIDTSNPAGFEVLNGRQLADDVIDVELTILTNEALTSDGVNANDNEFLNVFPYLAPPNP